MLTKILRFPVMFVCCLLLAACAGNRKPAGPRAPLNDNVGIYVGSVTVAFDGYEGINQTINSGIKVHLLQSIGDRKSGKFKTHVAYTDRSGLFYVSNVPKDAVYMLGKVEFKIGNGSGNIGEDTFKGSALGFGDAARVISCGHEFTVTEDGKVKSSFSINGDSKEQSSQKYPQNPWTNYTTNGTNSFSIVEVD